MKKDLNTLKRTALLLTVCALLIASLSGCFYVSESMLSKKTALEIKQAIYAADDPADQALYKAEDITFRYHANFNGTYVVLANEMFYSGGFGSGMDRVDGKEFWCSDYYVFTVYRDGTMLELQDAFDSGWLTSAQLQKVSDKLTAIKEEDDLIWQTERELMVNDPEPLSAERDLEIREDYCNSLNSKYGFHITPEELSIFYRGKFGDCDVMVMEGPFSYAGWLCTDIVHGVRFNYGSSQKMTAYHDGEFYSLRQAFEKGLLSVEDLEAIKTYRFVTN